MKQGLSTRDIAVIVQGPLMDGEVNIAARALRSVLEHLPGAQVILSTHDDIEGLHFEGVLVVQAQPARQFTDVNGNQNNVNKLISSMVGGLAQVDREFCIKLRTDHVLGSAAIVDCLDSVEREAAEARLFSSRVSVSNLFLRNPCKVPYLFHLTDTVQFGRTTDLRTLWNIQPISDSALFLKDGPRINPLGTFQGYTSFRLLPEQAIFLQFAQKQGLQLDLEHISHTSFELFNAWEELLAENFEVFDWHDLGILPPKRFLTAPYSPGSLMTREDLQTLRFSRSPLARASRYGDLLINKYLLCWFSRRWLVSVASLLLFSFSSELAVGARDYYRRMTGARRT